MSSAVKFGPLATAAVLAAVPAMADTRPMPDYFVSALVATSAAQALALSCAELSVDPVAIVKASEKLFTQLEEDGFDPSDPSAGMDNGDAELGAAQQAFMDKHQLDGAGSELVCAAGRSEMSEGTEIGLLLVEVPQ
ncbi:hypothetical protein BDE40_1663 [Litoreibacter halocynthiae]|uniref:Uncharacterized protein n=2 Tax=Litoreibacter TaxID=947567 RepID=A0A4R7LJX9_9RHOB|nr:MULTISPECIES: DUF5333 family protein [Litoreibacter]TDT74942.1 hypothetical protein BDE40_1663 [Litoreibacter halocynthiae]SHE46180.1 hypothetical protein SAMN05444273_101485 [Litoreibacter ascidiaceicola]